MCAARGTDEEVEVVLEVEIDKDHGRYSMITGLFNMIATERGGGEQQRRTSPSNRPSSSS
jgi:hypothetical protein